MKQHCGTIATLLMVIFFASTKIHADEPQDSGTQKCEDFNDFKMALLSDPSGKVAYDQFLANCDKDRDRDVFLKLTNWRLWIGIECSDVALLKSLDQSAVRAVINNGCPAPVKYYECPLPTDGGDEADKLDVDDLRADEPQDSGTQKCNDINRDFGMALVSDLSGKVAYDRFLNSCDKDRDVFLKLTHWRLCVAVKCSDVALVKSLLSSDEDAFQAVVNDICPALIREYECPLPTDGSGEADNLDVDN
ncbi:MAG: hypothetical protein V4534_07355 [Myxococcota bacterium]